MFPMKSQLSIVKKANVSIMEIFYAIKLLAVVWLLITWKIDPSTMNNCYFLWYWSYIFHVSSNRAARWINPPSIYQMSLLLLKIIRGLSVHSITLWALASSQGHLICFQTIWVVPVDPPIHWLAIASIRWINISINSNSCTLLIMGQHVDHHFKIMH